MTVREHLDLAVLVVALLLGLYLSWTATRLDRLHVRLDAARVALDAQLLRRSTAVLELARSGLLDPATALILAVPGGARGQDGRGGRARGRRVGADQGRARRLRGPGAGEHVRARDQPGGDEAVLDLGKARRVQLARRFHNESVRAVRQLRSHRLVRAFRLAGRAPFPQNFEIDEEPPAAL